MHIWQYNKWQSDLIQEILCRWRGIINQPFGRACEANTVRKERENNSNHLERENTERREKVAEKWLRLLNHTPDVMEAVLNDLLLFLKNGNDMFPLLIKEFT